VYVDLDNNATLLVFKDNAHETNVQMKPCRLNLIAFTWLFYAS